MEWAYPRLWVRLAVVFLSFGSVCGVVRSANPCHAEHGNGPDRRGDNDDMGPSNFAPPDRNVLQVLERAEKALSEHRYGAALEGLAEILRGSEDYFYQPDRKVSIYRS